MENCVYWKTTLILGRIQFLPMLKRDGRVGAGEGGMTSFSFYIAN